MQPDLSAKRRRSAGDRGEDHRYIIEIEKSGKKLDMVTAIMMLEDTGVKLDGSYGPYCVNSRLGRYVVRGRADNNALEKLRRKQGVRIYKDSRVNAL